MDINFRSIINNLTMRSLF